MTIQTLFERQVGALVKDVTRLHQTEGFDKELFQKIRKQISGELVNQGRLQIASAALGEIDDETVCDRLRNIINHCSENFYLEDRVLSAIVVPVGLRMKSTTSASLVLGEGDASNLNVLAKVTADISRARRVVLDRRLYDAKALYFCNAKQLFHHLLHLEEGSPRTEESPQSCSVQSDTNATWHMVYFLGVQITDVEGSRDLDALETQRVLGKWTHRAEWALTQSRQVTFTRGMQVQAQCHGVHYLGRGIRIGENIIRGHRLQQALANFDHDDQGAQLFYAHESCEFRVLLMAVSHVMTIEIRWKLMGSESLDGFKEQLQHAIAQVFPADTISALEQVELYDYKKLAREHGLNFMAGVL